MDAADAFLSSLKPTVGDYASKTVEIEKRQRSPEKKRSSPSPKRHRPSTTTEPSTILPLHKRKSRLTNWDIPPKGWEGKTAAQAKASGHFPLPGGVLRVAVDETAAMMVNTITVDEFGHYTDKSDAPKHLVPASSLKSSRRTYVGNLPQDTTAQQIEEFFNETFDSLNLAVSNPTVIQVILNDTRDYCFVEFATAEETTAALALDGMKFNETELKIRRPKDYKPTVSGLDLGMGSLVEPEIEIPSHRLYIGSLPDFLSEDQLKELLCAFGELEYIQLAIDVDGNSKGYAFCDYTDPDTAELAKHGLNGMEIGDSALSIHYAIFAGEEEPKLAGKSSISDDPTKVLQLINLASTEELLDGVEYADIVQVLREECSKYGEIVDMHVPRPSTLGMEQSGMGRAFILYSSEREAASALHSFCGRLFLDRIVLVSYYSEHMFLKKRADLRIDGITTPERPTVESLLSILFPAEKFRFIHQLDHATSGILCLGRNKKSTGLFCKEFQERRVKKTYTAILNGHIEFNEKEIECYLMTDPSNEHRVIQNDENGKKCITFIRLIRHARLDGNDVSYVFMEPFTGRRHQLRLVAKIIGHCIVGDWMYGESNGKDRDRMMLHAFKLQAKVNGIEFNLTSPCPLESFLNA